MLLHILICAIVSGMLCASELSIEDTVISLKQKMDAMEERFLSLESRETSDLARKVKDELFRELEDRDKKHLEEKNQLTAKMEESETASRNKQNDLAQKLHDLEQKSREQREEMSRRLSNVEMTCALSFEEVSGRLQNEKDSHTRVDTHLLIELQQVQKKSFEAQEKVLSLEYEIRKELDTESLKTNILQIKLNETREMFNSFLISERVVEDVIRKNISSSAEHLKLHFDGSLKLGLESIHSNFTNKIQSLENSFSNFEKECANASHVSRLQERLQNLEKTTEAELLSIRNELYPRVKQLEDKDDDVAVIKKTLRNHTSEIHAFNRQLFDIQNSCSGEPLSLQNGKPKNFDRKHGSSVRYACDENCVMTGNSTVRCNFGKWEGQPPVCNYFDTTFYVEYGRNITCYSDENADKMEFSRAFDTGAGTSLPWGTSRHTSNHSLRISFDGVAYREKLGVYRCEFNKEGRSMDIVVPVQSSLSYDFFFPEPFQVASIGDTFRMQMDMEGRYPFRWKHDGFNLPSWSSKKEVEIRSVKPTDAGVYFCYIEGTLLGKNPYIGLLRLIVRKCRENMYGEHCDQKCSPCYNGGVCHDRLGICICPEGFIGPNCERACPEGFHGARCSTKCSIENCQYTFLCKPDPYGCSCARGFTGTWCGDKCEPGRYGADCQQQCHCVNGPNDCNRFTGACSGGCVPGWTGESCQIEDVD